jgi:general secretion pathway protein D
MVLSAPQTWTVNFNDSEIGEVIKFVADATQKTIVIDPRVKGRVKVISATPLDREQLYNLFLSVLQIHGFTGIEVGGIVRIVPIKEARTSPAPIVDQVDDSGDVSLVTKVLQLKNVAAIKLLPVLRPLVAQTAHIAAYEPSNAIIISDSMANIARMEKLIARIDKAAVATTELVYLENAQAEDVVSILTKLQASGDKGKSGTQLKMVPDERSNAILLSGDDIQRQRIKNIISRLDQSRPQSGNVRVIYLEYAEAEKVAEVLSKVVKNMASLTPGGDSKKGGTATIEADADTNALLITADPDTLDSLLAVVDRLDIRRAQVLVEAIIVEVNDIAGRDLGIEWLFRDDNGGFGSSVNPDSSIGAIASAANSGDDDESALASLAGALTSIPGATFGAGRLNKDIDFVVLLNALQQDTGTNILSTPNLLTMDNHAATISVGQEVPFITGSFTNTGGNNPSNPFQTIERKNVGIKLEVTPHINDGSSMVLEIVQEDSSLTGATGINASDVITNERTIETKIMAEDGEVVVLGGLIRDDVNVFEQRVPVLGSIPILGRLFRTESNAITKTNLMVFIRASILRDKEDIRGATAEKYRYIRDQQLNTRQLDSLMIDDDLMKIIPEWEEQIRSSKNTDAGASQ